MDPLVLCLMYQNYHICYLSKVKMKIQLSCRAVMPNMVYHTMLKTDIARSVLQTGLISFQLEWVVFSSVFVVEVSRLFVPRVRKRS
jgi:hypothetical protein